MTKVIWVGEDNEADEYAGPSYTVWNGIKFPKDKPVEVVDEHMLTKARGNRYFKVIEDKPEKPVVVPHKYVSKEELAERYPTDDMADVKRVVAGRKPQEKQDAQTKAQELTDKAQDLKAKVERKKYNYRKAEKGSGYSPQKPKAKKEKATDHPADNADP